MNDDIDMTFCKMKSILASNVSFNEPAGKRTASREKLMTINSLSTSPIDIFDSNNNLDATGYHHSVLNGNTSEKPEVEQSSGAVKLKSEVRASSSVKDVNDVSTQKLIDQIATTRRFTKDNMHLGADLAALNPSDRRLSKKSIDLNTSGRHDNRNEGELSYAKPVVVSIFQVYFHLETFKAPWAISSSTSSMTRHVKSSTSF